MYKIFCDGGSRGNPGPAASAFVVYDSDSKEVFKLGKFLGKATNNIAEYSAVISALSWLIENEKTSSLIEFYLDSQLIVNQMAGSYKIKEENLKLLAIKIKKMESLFKNKISYQHIPREENKIADKLVNETLDLYLT